MSHTPNELADMFPGKNNEIHTLKIENEEFSQLHDAYHKVTREIHRGETNIEPMDDVRLEGLRKLRLRMLDQVSALLK